MLILDKEQIKQKTKRLAIEILENNYGTDTLYFAGINNNGLKFAKSIGLYAKRHEEFTIKYINVRVNAANPIANNIEIDVPLEELKGKVVILVDDVANTGRTLFYACKPFMEIIAKRIEIAVLVDRKHKSFPIYAKYVGISLATTLGENIEVRLEGADDKSVHVV